jgi:hypothetical protein
VGSQRSSATFCGESNETKNGPEESGFVIVKWYFLDNAAAAARGLAVADLKEMK